MAVEASDSHVGAVLQQRLRGSWSPLVFFSKKLSSKSKCSAFDRELLTAYSSVCHFRFLLETREFTLFTNHKPLTLVLFCSSPPWFGRQQHHLAYISEFTISASAPAVPVFSTMPLDLSASGFDFTSLPALQSTCPSVQSMISNPSLSVVSVPFLLSSILCDVSSGSSRPLVPSTLHHQLFLALHGLSHPGVHAYRRFLSSKFVWPGFAKDVGLWTRSCLRCQQSKIQSCVKSPVPRIPVPAGGFPTCTWIWWPHYPPARGTATS